MMRRRNGRRPAFEALEGRQVMSQGVLPLPPTLGTGVAQVSTPGGVGTAPFTVQPQNLAGGQKRSSVVALQANPQPGSPLQPKFLAPVGPNGQPVPFRHGAPFVPGVHGEALGYARVSQPGAHAARLTGRVGTTGTAAVNTSLAGDVTGDGKVDLLDLRVFAASYLSKVGDAFYTPAADVDRNGFVGQGDGRIIERNVTPLSPRIPLSVRLALAPGEYAHGVQQETSGGITRLTKVTVVGHTTPGSLIFSDSGLGNYTFDGAALVADEHGNFQITFTLNPEDRLKNTEYLVIDPFGQQTIRAFPILYVGPTK